jgi:hypothetical protein
VIEIFEVRLVNGIADDFNIKVVEIRCGEAFTEVGSCGMNVERLFGSGRRKRTEGCLNKHTLVQFLDVRSDTQCGHRVKHTKRMTALQQFMRIPLVQSPSDQENDIVNHIGVAIAAQSVPAHTRLWGNYT